MGKSEGEGGAYAVGKGTERGDSKGWAEILGIADRSLKSCNFKVRHE